MPIIGDLMNRIIIACILILSISLFPCLIFSADPIPQSEPHNYCKDPSSWKEWNELVAKYPNDMDIQTLHALRLGLCLKIERGSITFQEATDLFNRAHEMVIQKKFYEQKKKKRKL